MNRLLSAMFATLLMSACADGGERGAAGDYEAGGAVEAEQLDSATLAEAVLPDSVSYIDEAPSSAPDDAELARQVIVDYYAAIDVQDYQRAFSRWGDRGRASGQTYLEFVAGYAETRSASVTAGDLGRIEGAAGSRYVEIPVVVQAVTRAGERQRFEGSYTLRRTVVDGATPEQREWHLHDARLTRVR